MTLGVALSSAVSSLLVVEKQMSVASNNISNANTVGYTQQTDQVGSNSTAGVGTGVVDLGVTTNIDQYVLKAMASSNSDAAQASSYSDMYQSLQQDFGQISLNDTGGNDLASQLSTLQTTMNQAADAPQNVALKTQVIGQIDTLSTNFRQTSGQIQTLRSDADQQISQVVTDVNAQLTTISKLNQQIQIAGNNVQSTATAENQRADALQALSNDIGISYYTDSSGMTQIYSSAGTPLLVGTEPRLLSHDAVGAMAPNLSYSPTPPSGIDGIHSGNSDITNQITGGTLGALIKMRDTELPNAQAALDNLAQSFSSTVNSAYNLGTSVPAPAALTSANTTPMQGTDPVYVAPGTTVRVAVLDAAGNVSSYNDLDLDAAGVTDLGDVVNALNGGFASQTPPVSATASLNGQGQLVISATGSGQGIGITTLSGGISSSPISATNTGTDFSNFYQMNNLITGGNSASSITVRPDILKQPNLMAVGQLVKTANPGTPPFVGVTAGDGSIASSLSDTMLGNQTFKSAGYIGSSSTSFSSYATNLISDIANRASNAKSDSTTKTAMFNTLQQTYSSDTGVNVDQQTAQLANLQTLYAASAKVVATVNQMFQDLLTALQ